MRLTSNNNTKGFTSVLIILLVIGLVIVGYYAISQKVPVNRAGNNLESVDNSSLKTFRTEDFTIKYPSTWTIEKVDQEPHKDSSYKPVAILKRSGVNYQEYPRAADISYWDNPHNLTLEELEHSLFNEELGTGPQFFHESAEIKTLGYDNAVYIKDADCHPLKCEKYLIEKPGKLYVIDIYPDPELEGIFNSLNFSI